MLLLFIVFIFSFSHLKVSFFQNLIAKYLGLIKQFLVKIADVTSFLKKEKFGYLKIDDRVNYKVP